MALQLVSKTGRPLKVIQVKVIRHGRRIVIDGQIYEQLRGYATIEHADIDLKAVEDEMQRQFNDQGINATVGEVRHIRAKNYDHMICDAWTPAESPIAPLVVLAIIGIIKLAIIAAAIIVPAVIVSNIIWNWTHRAVFNPIDGKEFDSIVAMEADKRERYPDAPPYTCPYCGQQFWTADERNDHVKECLFAPPGVPGWLPWVVGGVIATVFGVYVAPKIIDLVRRR